MKDQLQEYLKGVVVKFGEDISAPQLDYPENTDHGDFTTNVAMANAKKLGIAPKVLAEKIIAEVKSSMPDYLKDASVAGPGFINFFVKDAEIQKEILKVNMVEKNIAVETIGSAEKTGEANASAYGRSDALKGKNVLVEYTDPNIFKVFHIGHLMSNAIGESISRLVEYSGANVTRICYPADIGLHIAKSVWAVEKHLLDMPEESAPIKARTDFLGKMYVLGTNAYEADPKAKEDIDALNKALYEKSDKKANEIYEKGRRWSLEHFELLYKILGTKFDDQIYESEVAPVGLEAVKENLKKGIFEESQGAIVFKGEQYGLHTRVFVNAHGVPTYEAKDLGLNITKFKKYPNTDQSIIITASEQNDYFKVLLKAVSLIDEKNGQKTKHIGHGMMRFLAGKMSSRTGNVITAESLMADISELVKAKIVDRGFSADEAEEISNIITVGAIKYSILRSAPGSDIIFDSSASISFEGDSGPYLQYAAVRANSILEKALKEGIEPIVAGADIVAGSLDANIMPGKLSLLEKLLTRFPDMVSRSRKEFAPQLIANYLINLAGAWNSFYASQVIVDKSSKVSPYYVSLTKAFLTTMTNGLWILGIKVPKKM